MSENDGQEISRRGFLVKARNFLAAAALAPRTIPDLVAEKPQQIEKEKVSEKWGSIANVGHDGDATRGIFFFAGERNTRSPYSHLQPVTEWNNENVGKIFDEIKNTNVNVIKLSWWGDENETEQWAPTINTESVNRKVFEEAGKRDMLVAPVIEVSPNFEFWKDFPDNTDKLEDRITTLLSQFGREENWLKMYNRNGEKRTVIQLIETIHGTPVDEDKFADTFDLVVDKILQKTGIAIGFVIDPTPLPAHGSYEGPNEKKLFDKKSILGVGAYNIFSDGESEKERFENAQKVMERWISSGIPVVLPLVTEFNDEGTDRIHTQKFGNTAEWRTRLKDFVAKYANQVKGISFDSWNTFTEGGAVTPTVEYGDKNLQFAREILATPAFNPPLKRELKYKAVVPSVARD